MPLGLIAWFRRDPAQARTVLAHEVAHVVQQDATLWRLNYLVGLSLYRSLSRLNLAPIAFGFVFVFAFYMTLRLQLHHTERESIDQALNLIWGKWVAGTTASMIIFGMLRNTAMVVANSRYASECLADIGAALCVGDGEYSRTVVSLMPNHIPTHMHPASADRVGVVAKLFASDRLDQPLAIGNAPL